MGVIELADTAWDALIVLAPEKDFLLCFWADQEKVYAAIVSDASPILRIQENSNALGDRMAWFTLDANGNYWKL